jgi:hypothetical protein
MATETTQLLRRVVTLRHTPEGRMFWSAALSALTAGTGDAELACELLAATLRRPPAADSVRDWLTAVALGGDRPVPLAPVLAHVGAVSAALAAVHPGRPTGASVQGVRMRSRVRELVDAAALV